MEQRKQQEYAEENWMQITFAAKSENEGFARTAVAAFVSSLDPTIEELADIKTAVSEAVSNSIIHGYRDCEDRTAAKVSMECAMYDGGKIVITVEDQGIGIKDVKQAMEPMFSTGDSEERSGMGFIVMESFTDKLKVRSEEGRGTTVIMIKYLDVVSGI